MSKTKKHIRRRSRPTALTEREQQALLEQPDTRYPIGLRNRVYIRLQLNTGLRLAEMLDLRWGRIDFSNGKLQVRGIEANDRVLWLHEYVRKRLKSWNERQAMEWEKRQIQEDAPDASPDHVFTNLNGSRVSERYVRKMVAWQADEAGLQKKVTPSVIRHTFATNLYLETGNLRRVQKALGHKKQSRTRVYVEVVQDRLTDAVKHVPHAAVQSSATDDSRLMPRYSKDQFGRKQTVEFDRNLFPKTRLNQGDDVSEPNRPEPA